MDWLVAARLLACAIAFIVGIILIPKNVSWGFGAKSLLVYLLAAGISAIKSPYPVTVVGYFILLLGASVLMIALTYSARNVLQLERIEKIWFLTVTILVIKDAITSLMFPEMEGTTTRGTFRLGMGVTHAVALSFLAGLVFWLSLKEARPTHPIMVWPIRFFCIFVILLARSRVPIASFLFAGCCFFLFKRNDLKRWVIVPACIGLLVTFLILNLSFGSPWADETVKYLKRGQGITGLKTFTSRTYIWGHVLNKSMDSPIVGHGFGVSRLTMGNPPGVSFQPDHCHNEALEVFFDMGLFGLIPFFAMFMYSLRWIKDSSRLRRVFSTDMALHGICVVAMLLASSMFEIRVAARVTPIQPLFFLYLLTLDRERHFLQLRKNV
jgi:O-antigen ligase